MELFADFTGHTEGWCWGGVASQNGKAAYSGGSAGAGAAARREDIPHQRRGYRRIVLRRICA